MDRLDKHSRGLRDDELAFVHAGGFEVYGHESVMATQVDAAEHLRDRMASSRTLVTVSVTQKGANHGQHAA